MNKLFHQGFALIIGVGGDLACTVNDAHGVGKILIDSDRCAYLPQNVTVLTEQKATAARIRYELQKLAHLVAEHQNGSTAIVYFSGHGWRINSSDEDGYYLIPYGFNPVQRKQTGLCATEFSELLEAVQAERFLLLLDCCHAGGFELAKSVEISQTNEALFPEVQRRFISKRGRAVIASSQKDELSLAGTPYSAFTHSLLEAFCGKGSARKDGFVRVADLAMYTSRQVAWNTHEKQHPTLDYRQADNFEVAYYGAGSNQGKALPFDSLTLTHEPHESKQGKRIQINNKWNTGRIVIDGENHGSVVYNEGPSPEDIEKIIRQAKEVFYASYNQQDAEKQIEKIKNELYEYRDPGQLSGALHHVLAAIPIASAAFTLGSVYAHPQIESVGHLIANHDLHDISSSHSVDQPIHHDLGQEPVEGDVAALPHGADAHADYAEISDLDNDAHRDWVGHTHDAPLLDVEHVDIDSPDDFHSSDHGADGHHGYE